MNWVVITLIGFLAVITLVTIAVLFKVFLSGGANTKESSDKKSAKANKKPKKPNKKPDPARTGSGSTSSGSIAPRKPEPAENRPQPEPEKSLAKKVLEEEEADPVAEAEIFLTYGLNNKAVEVLAKHLETNPSDKAALALLEKAQKV